MGEKRPKEPDPPIQIPTEDDSDVKGEKVDAETLEFMHTPIDERDMYLFKKIRSYYRASKDYALGLAKTLDSEDATIRETVKTLETTLVNEINELTRRANTADEKFISIEEDIALQFTEMKEDIDGQLTEIKDDITDIKKTLTSIDGSIIELQRDSHPPP